MALGIDQQIQDRANAYRENPAALEKNYSINKDLLDLLALQKIKSEKDAAARELQLSQQQVPQTIAQQRGKEAVDRTKGDLTNQVSGVLKQKQARQQQNMQRAAAPPAGAPPAGAPPAGAPPVGRRPVNRQMAGVAGQPAPNMARMAHGGIVTFQAGKEVKAPTQEELLARAGITLERFLGMSEAEKNQVLQTLNIPIAAKKAFGGQGNIAAHIPAALYDVASMPQKLAGKAIGMVGRATGLRDPAAADPLQSRLGSTSWTPAADKLRRMSDIPYVTMAQLHPQKLAEQNAEQNRILAEQKRMQQGQLSGPPIRQAGTTSDPSNIPNYIPGTEGGEPVLPPTTDAGGISTVIPRAGTQVDTSKISRSGDIAYQDPTRTMRGADLITRQDNLWDKWQNIVNQDPTKVRDAQTAWAGNIANREGIAGQYKTMQERIADQNKAAQATIANNKFHDLLAASGGRGALSNIGRESANTRRRELLDKERQLGTELAMQREGIKVDQDIAGKMIDVGKEGFKLSTEDRQKGFQESQKLLKTGMDQLSDAAKQILQADIANLTEQAAYRRDMVSFLTTNASLAVKMGIAELNGRLTVDTNAIKKLAVEATNARTLAVAVNQMTAAIGKIKGSAADKLTAMLEDDTVYMQLKGAERANYRKQILTIINKTLENGVAELEGMHKFFEGRLQAMTRGWPSQFEVKKKTP